MKSEFIQEALFTIILSALVLCLIHLGYRQTLGNLRSVILSQQVVHDPRLVNPAVEGWSTEQNWQQSYANKLNYKITN